MSGHTPWDEVKAGRPTDGERDSAPTTELASQIQCCDDPQPRVLEKNHRPFCYNCRRYLDVNISRPPEGDEA